MEGEDRMTVILILSIMVNLVTILTVIILYSRQNRLIDFENNYKDSIKEMEELINTFIFEMKEENDEIKQLFRSESEGPIKEKQQSDADVDIDQEVMGLPQGYRQQAALNAYTNSSGQSIEAKRIVKRAESVREGQESDQNSVLTEVINMRNQGLTIEEIAKKMGRGKTEIDLLIKLNQK